MALFGRPTPQDEAKALAYREWFLRQHPLALASLVLSVFSFTHFGLLWVDEILGIVLGVIAIRSAKPGQNVRLAWLGIVIGILSLVSAVILYTR